MDFLRLPQEIIIIVIRKLDTKSVLSLYNTCTYLQHLVCMHNVVKTCGLSLNSLATAQSLKLDFIKNISGHLQELDMSAVSDLSKTTLQPAIKKMKCLITLNVAYTKITLLEFIDLYKVCSTIKNIVINFQIDECGQTLNERLKSCQSIFEKLEKVHFVGSCSDLLCCGLPNYILKYAAPNSLTYTIVRKQAAASYKWSNKEVLKFKNFNMFILNWENIYDYSKKSIFSLLDLEKNDYIIITVQNTTLLKNTHKIYASNQFTNFFANTLELDVNCNLNCIDAFQGNVVIMLWDKKVITFDALFYKKLCIKLQKYFPSNYHLCNPTDNKDNNWFYLIPKVQLNEKAKDPVNYSPDIKKKRIVPESVTLNYDELCLEEQFVELTLCFNGTIRNPVTLSSSTEYLKRMTLLSLTGPVRYSSDFFKVLFQCCVNLKTLNVEAFVISPCALAISKSIHLSKTIKHLRLMDKRMDFKTLFTSLSKCKTLENIHLHDMSTECSYLADPSVLFEQCENLYHLFIIAAMTQTTKTNSLRLFQKVKSKCKKSYLHVELYNHSDDVKYYYDPYVNIFKIIPIQLPTL